VDRGGGCRGCEAGRENCVGHVRGVAECIVLTQPCESWLPPEDHGPVTKAHNAVASVQQRYKCLRVRTLKWTLTASVTGQSDRLVSCGD
jgi:hypothetical protein